ncbi:MAG TPA: hypothetical protein PK210_05530 [Bacteroidia bacterium]|nr:hypothetical protein [Bacteroidia bacterium]
MMMPVMDGVEACRVMRTMPALNKTIKALLRSANELPVVDATITAVGGLKIDRKFYLIHQDGQTFELPCKEIELIALLASKPGKVFSREDILSRV